MRVLLDTNVVLDVLLNRDPWVQDSAAVWQASDQGRIVGHVVASTITTVFYVARRLADLQTARFAVRTCLEAFEIVAVGREALELAEKLPGSDFEDGLQVACASLEGLEVIVTRDKSGFHAANIPVFAPPELLTRLS
jgi:predicted nucleic acid-binding protein